MKLDFSKQKALLITILIFSLIAFSTRLIRLNDNPYLIGHEQYSMLSEKTGFNPAQVLLSSIKTNNLLISLMPFLLGIAVLILLYEILTVFKMRKEQKFISLLLLAISPAFIYAFILYTNIAFLIFFNALFLFFYVKKQHALSFLSFLPTVLINPIFSLITLSLILAAESLKKSDKRKARNFSIAIIISSLISYFALFFGKYIPNRLFFAAKPIFVNTVSDFGALFGIGVFQLLLAVIGVSILWSKKARFFSRKHKYRFHIVFLAVLFIFSAYFKTLIFVLNFFITFFAAFALLVIYNRKWQLSGLKKVALMLIIYGLLFSTISFQTRLIMEGPSPEHAAALKTLESEEESLVLSHYKNSDFIEFFAKKQPFLNQNIEFMKDGNAKLDIAEEIFNSREVEKTKRLMLDNNILYILIDSQMKSGLVWEERDEGLLFILDTSFQFEKLYDSKGVEVWKLFDIPLNESI